MRANACLLAIGLTAASAAALIGGCRNPPPPQINVPSSSGHNPYTTYEHDEVKPLPPSATQSMAEPPQDLLDQSRPAVGLAEVVPQQPTVSQTYLDSYDRVAHHALDQVVIFLNHAAVRLVRAVDDDDQPRSADAIV